MFPVTDSWSHDITLTWTWVSRDQISESKKSESEECDWLWWWGEWFHKVLPKSPSSVTTTTPSQLPGIDLWWKAGESTTVVSLVTKWLQVPVTTPRSTVTTHSHCEKMPAKAEDILSGFRVNWMNLRDADTGKILWQVGNGIKLLLNYLVDCQVCT